MKIRKKWITTYLLAFCLLLSCFFLNPVFVYADNQKEYSSVLTDLQKDTAFNIEDYPGISEDYSLNVIQIAESTDKELYVYVYQPSGDFGSLVASSINISTNDLNFINYTLTLCNYNSTLYKYLVNDFVVSDNNVREYEITSIYRPFNALIDSNTNNDNIINEINYPVSKKWIFSTTDAGITLDCIDIETITVTDKYVGFVRYDGASNFWGTDWKCDSHFVAFSTDKQIDHLINADVYFNYTPFHWQQNGTQLTITRNDGTTFSNRVAEDDVRDFILTNDCMPYESFVYLSGEQTGVYESGKWKYDWQRIQTVSEFIQSEYFENTYDNGFISINQSASLTDDGRANIESKQWVLRFFETEYVNTPGWYGGSFDQTMVYNVSILRLHFQTDSSIYDLGVIDNKQSGSQESTNVITTTYGLGYYLKIVLAIILFVFVALCCPWVFKLLWLIISAPFKFVSWIVKSVKKSKQKKNTHKKGDRK